jgi:signal transduction histidine kinase
VKLFTILFGDRPSLQRSLVFNIVLALVFLFALVIAILIRESYEHLRERTELRLFLEAVEIARQIDPASESLGLDSDGFRFRSEEGLYHYTVLDQTGQAIVGGEQSDAIAPVLPGLVAGQPQIFALSETRTGAILRTTRDQGEWFVLVSTHASGAGQNQIMIFLDELSENAYFVLAGLIAVLGAVFLTTRRTLRPLIIISQQAHDIGPKSTGARLSTQNLPSEIMPLVAAVNGAFDRLEKGYRAQRDFSSNVAHEVRTPLAVLRSSIELIEDAQVRDGLKQDVRRLDQLFEQLIDLSRAEALGPASFQPVDLHQIAVDVASDMASFAVQCGKSLAVTGADPCPAEGHAGLLSIALANLVRNALSYSPEGTEVEILVLDTNPGWQVLDRGPGVPEAQKSALFQRFHRGAATPQQTKGSGIGLAIVKSVADAHGATVTISERPGGGSIFTFEFTA